MFKRKKKKEIVPQIAASHPLFDFSVMDSDMRGAARDYSTTKAPIALQKKELKSVPVEKDVLPTVRPQKTVQPATVAGKKRPLISRFVLLSGVFILLAIATGGGVLVWNLQKNETTQVVALPPGESVTVVPVQEKPSEIPPAERLDVQGKDTDSDGLTDAEERIFGTDVRNPDTDEDTYLDSNEVFHGYDPTTPSPASLANSAVAKEYTYAGVPKFSLLTLNQWSLDAPTIVAEGSQGSVRLLTTTGSEFRIQLQERNPEQTLGDWYDAALSWRERYGDGKDFQAFVSKQGYVGRMTADKRAAFLDVGTHIAIFEYDLKTERTVEYAQVFQMMLNSFKLLP